MPGLFGQLFVALSAVIKLIHFQCKLTVFPLVSKEGLEHYLTETGTRAVKVSRCGEWRK